MMAILTEDPKMNKKTIFAGVALLISISWIGGCQKNRAEEDQLVKGSLEVSFDMLSPEQTVIWLEDKHQNYMETFYLSNWMANDGTWSSRYSNMLPEWRSKARWEAADPDWDYVDGISGATPSKGYYTFTIELDTLELKKALYHFCVETTLIDEHSGNTYNILHRGSLELGGPDSESSPPAEYTPALPPEADRIIENIKGVYRHP